ncbi:Tyrosine-specific transport protein 1 [Bienertia sinuspersici]
MKEDGVKEVSFTGLATKAFGAPFGAFVSAVYASLSFSLLVACVSGIGSIVSQWFPELGNAASHSLFPLFIGCIIWLFPFKAIDSMNRFLCLIMLFSIITLVGIGVSVARANLLVSLSNASWNMFSILPAIPVTVLTLGFHVITPFICKVAGDSIDEARKAILIGGIVPLIMVLLAGTKEAHSPSFQGDPIKVLLSVKSSALFAVQGFAFSALATSFIGYTVSLPKQLIDTLELIFRSTNSEYELGLKNSMKACSITVDSSGKSSLSRIQISKFEGLISVAVLLITVLVASFHTSTFSRALEFAGVYANCFLFGILPPAMAYISKSRRKLRSSLPGGNTVLFLLFSISVLLSIWH